MTAIINSELNGPCLKPLSFYANLILIILSAIKLKYVNSLNLMSGTKDKQKLLERGHFL